MFPINAPFDRILQSVVSILENGVGSSEMIEKMIKEATPSALMPTFSFLYSWTSSHNTTLKRPKNVRIAFQLIGILVTKIPPVLLITSGFDINEGINQDCCSLSSFFVSINKRIKLIREYLQPISGNGEIYPFPLTMDFKDDMWSLCDADLTLELGFENASSRAYIDHFKRMILNRVPIQFFKPYLEQKSRAEVLTRAIIEIIDELNESKTATHMQLLVGFTNVFQYTQFFATMMPNFSALDVKMLSNYIQTMPTMSPMCAVAIINQISPSVYLYNMLVPDVNGPQDHSGYTLFDKTQDTVIPHETENINIALNNYFNPPETSLGTCDDSFFKNDNYTIMDLLVYLITDKSDYNKKSIKIVNTLAQGREIKTDYLYALGSLHMNRIVTLVNGQITSCVEKTMFKRRFISFIKGLTCQMCPTMSDKIGTYLMKNTSGKPQKEMNYLITILSTTMMENVLNSPNETIIPFAIDFAKRANPDGPRHLIRRILLNDLPKIGPKVQAAILDCNDIVILLSFADALVNATMVHTCAQRDEKLDLVKSIMNKLPFEFKPLDDTFRRIEITSVKNFFDESQFNESSVRLIKKFMVASSQYLPPIDDIELIQILMFSTSMNNNEFASRLIERIANETFKRYKSEENEMASKEKSNGYDTTISYILKLDSITVTSTYNLAILQQCMQQALSIGSSQEAFTYIRQIEDVLKEDDVSMHWIYLLLNRFRSMIVSIPTLRITLSKVINSKISNYAQLNPDNNLMLDLTSPSYVCSIINILIKNDKPLLQNPSVVKSEYLGPYFQALASTRCQLLLSEATDKAIAEALAGPLYDTLYPWENKVDAMTQLGKFVSGLSDGIIKEFLNIINQNYTSSSIICGRVLIAMTNIDVFLSLLNTVKVQDDKLEQFMQMMLPSFYRVSGSKEAAMSIINIFLNSFQAKTTKFTSTAIDIIGFLYIKLELEQYRTEILERARILPESSTIILEAYLDPNFKQASKRPLFRPKQDPDQQKKKSKPTI